MWSTIAIIFAIYSISTILQLLLILGMDSDRKEDMLMGAFIPFAILLMAISIHIRANIEHTIDEMNRYNILYECRDCKRLFRKYHMVLSKKKNNAEVECCPDENCKSVNYRKIKGEDIKSWHNTEPDCIKIGLFQMVKIKRAIKDIDKINKNIKEINSYLSYKKKRDGNNEKNDV